MDRERPFKKHLADQFANESGGADDGNVWHFRKPPGGLAQPRAPSLVSLTEARQCDKATAALVQESLVWDTLVTYWREITASAALIDAVLIAITIPWALRIKKDA